MQVTRVANLTAGEQEEIWSMVGKEFAAFEKRVENEHLKRMAEMNAALDQIQDAARLVVEVRSELSRVVNLVEGLETRLQDVEAEFGW
jgi:hypothetical protein